MKNILNKHIFVITLFIFLAVMFTRPLYKQMNTHLPGYPNDPLMGAYIMGWGCNSIDHGFAKYWDCPMFYPEKNSMARLDNIFSIVLMAYPLHFLTANYIFIHNILLILGYALNGIVFYFIIYCYTKNVNAGIVSGIIFAFNGYIVGQTVHIHLVHAWCIPLSLYFLYQYLKTTALRYCVYTTISYLFTSLMTGHFAVYITMLFLVVSVYYIYVLKPGKRIIIPVLISFIVTILIFYPFYDHHKQLSSKREVDYIIYFSPEPTSFLRANNTSYIYSHILKNKIANLFSHKKYEPRMFLGFTCILLAFIGFNKTPHKWFYACMTLFIVILAIGPYWFSTSFKLPYYYLCKLPIVNAIRCTDRIWILFTMNVAYFAGYGIKRAWKYNRMLSITLSVLLLAELHITGIQTERITNDGNIPVCYTELILLPSGAVVYAPISKNAAKHIYYSLYHNKPLINGYASFVPAWYDQLIREINGCKTRECEDAIYKKYDAKYIIR